MARADYNADLDRIARKETNNQSDGRTDAGPRRLDGLATPRSNPRKDGGGINRQKSKSKLQ